MGAIVLVAEQAPKTGQTPSAPAPAAPAAAPGAQKTLPAGYVGDGAKCIECHDTQSYKGTAHGRDFKDRSPAATHGCESCHGRDDDMEPLCGRPQVLRPADDRGMD